eukprot:539449-Rhodomonas_salina.2
MTLALTSVACVRSDADGCLASSYVPPYVKLSNERLLDRNWFQKKIGGQVGCLRSMCVMCVEHRGVAFTHKTPCGVWHSHITFHAPTVMCGARWNVHMAVRGWGRAGDIFRGAV